MNCATPASPSATRPTHICTWQAPSDDQNRGELEKSNARFRAELGEVPAIIAYPYGEYSLAVGRLSKEAGLTVGFGQHSGVVHADSDMLYLPRFAMNENFGGIGPLQTRGQCPSPGRDGGDACRPFVIGSNNPPILGFTVQEPAAKRLSGLACYASGQGKVRIERLGSRVEVRLQEAFSSGRARINCTMPTRSGRWRWFGLQFYVPKS